MVPHDSDSSGDEQDDFTETNVLLGYASKEPEDISHLGGRPVINPPPPPPFFLHSVLLFQNKHQITNNHNKEWLELDTPPSAALARCKVCKDLMVLLLQLNAELPAQFPGHDRRLYVFSCRRKTCRRKEGSIRAVRGVKIAPGSGSGSSSSNATKRDEEKPKQGNQKKQEEPKPPSHLGETLFGAKTLGSSSGSANPFSTGGGGSSNPFASNSNPFSSSTPATIGAAEAQKATDDDNAKKQEREEQQGQLESLPKTFAETLSLNNPQAQTQTQTHTPASPPSPPEPWPPESSQPAPYPISYLTEAEYETLDPTPAPVSQATTTMKMDVDSEPSGSKPSSKGGGKEDRDVFESSMDSAFQKFADRLAQNPDQAIRYEYGGQPLLSSKEDAVGALLTTDPASAGKAMGKGMPRCGNCGARRTFEVQLCPHAITELEAEEMSSLEDGMDWGTVIVGVCERDCQVAGVGEGGAGYLEEWAGVQWEELAGGGRR